MMKIEPLNDMTDELKSTRFEGAIPEAAEMSPEAIERERINRVDDLRIAAEKQARLKLLAQQEDEAEQHRIREKIRASGEAGQMGLREALVIPADRMEEARTYIRTEQSKLAGVLTPGNVDHTRTDVRGVELTGPSFSSAAPDFDSAPDNSAVYHDAPAAAARTRRREALKRGTELHQEASLIRDVLEGVGQSPSIPPEKPKRLTDMRRPGEPTMEEEINTAFDKLIQTEKPPAPGKKSDVA